MTKTKQLRSALAILLIAGISFSSMAQTAHTEPWTTKQLMPPAELATIIRDKSAHQPIVFSIGPGAMVKGSIDIGAVQKKENLEKFREALAKLPKNADIVIYCGCCPFAHCPNIRPAFQLLNEMKFTNQKLLSLQTNIRVDWIDQGYPGNN